MIVSEWDNFFAALVGASAALAGLLFVGLSINLSKILQFAALPTRALEALILLFTILVVSACVLIPEQSDLALGTELAAVGLGVAVALGRLGTQSIRATPTEYRRFHILEIGLCELICILYFTAGVLVAFGNLVGIYFIVPAALVSFALAITDSWVLLVEVNR